jgi:hypothetical protein
MSKIGRNNLCFCGSEKKYKKCCLKKLIPFSQPSVNAPGTILVNTSTNEPLMPVRLYYTIENPKQFITELTKLKCVDSYDDNSCIINYEHETKNLGLKVAYNEVPEGLYPIILASCISKVNGIHINLKSFKRAVLLIGFIDRIVPRDIAKITHVATYNRLIFSSSMESTAKFIEDKNYDNIFAEDKMTIRGKQNFNPYIADKDQTSLLSEQPIVEKFPAYFYEDGIKRIECLLNFRRTIASGIGMNHKSIIPVNQ